MNNKKFVCAVLIPIFTLIAVFLVFPLLYGLGISFFDYNPLRHENPFAGISNYSKLLQDEVFIIAVRNTLFFVFVTVALNIVVTLLFAKLITALPGNKARSLFRTVFFLPCVAPMVASSIVWGSNIYSIRSGIVNAVLKSIDATPVNFLGDPSVIMYALILFTLWVDFGYNTVLFSAGLDAIPVQFEESAKIDGANALQRFFHITFPLLGRTFVFVTIVTIISHFQMFIQFMVLALRGGPNYSSTVLTLYVYKTAFIDKDMGYASAIAMVLFVIIMAVTLIQRKLGRIDWGY